MIVIECDDYDEDDEILAGFMPSHLGSQWAHQKVFTSLTRRALE